MVSSGSKASGQPGGVVGVAVTVKVRVLVGVA